MQRRSGLCAAQISGSVSGLQQVKCTGTAISFREEHHVRHAHGGHNYGDTARDYLCTHSKGECTAAIVRTGVACSSFVRWLVILIARSSSEVGARSAPGAEAGSMYAQGHRRFGAIVPTRRSGGKVYRSARRERRENRRHTTHAASYQPVRLGRHAAGGAVRQERQANELARRTRGCEGRAGVASLCSRSAKSIFESRKKCNDKYLPPKARAVVLLQY